MPAEIEIRTADEQAYPVPADVEAGAVERGWKAGWTVTVHDAGGTLGKYLGWIGTRGVIEDEDEALRIAMDQAETPGTTRVVLREISAYDREQIAAECAFEARHG